jgi:flagellin-like protein
VASSRRKCSSDVCGECRTLRGIGPEGRFNSHGTMTPDRFLTCPGSRKLPKDTHAVSAIVGTILMLAVTVALAALVWALVQPFMDLDPQACGINVDCSTAEYDPDGDGITTGHPPEDAERRYSVEPLKGHLCRESLTGADWLCWKVDL